MSENIVYKSIAELVGNTPLVEIGISIHQVQLRIVQQLQ